MNDRRGERETPVQVASFTTLIQRVRAGDEQAAAALVERYQPHILRVVRERMAGSALRRKLDSADICQSVLANFFVRVAMGQFDLGNPRQLIGLLSAMTRNQFSKKLEQEYAERRDVRRLERVSVDELNCAGAGHTPSSICANKEILDEFRRRLTPQERYIADQRALGRSWADLAEELGLAADTLRMRFSRALDRAAQELGMTEM